jgi:pyrimidine deaminase RibD-like protein
MALRQVRGNLSDVTAYVTLEPCSFHGRTPSCAQALISRGVAEVVVATIDPDTRNSGRGIDALMVAGVRVTLGILAAEALSDLEPYLALAGNVAPS